MMKQRLKLVGLYILSFVLSVLPVLVYFIINHNRYICTIPDRIKLGFGAVALCVIIGLKLAGKLKIKSRIVVFAIVFGFSYLLESILDDLLVFSLLALVGEAFDMIVGIFIKREKRKMLLKESADANAAANEKVIEKIINKVSGR